MIAPSLHPSSATATHSPAEHPRPRTGAWRWALAVLLAGLAFTAWLAWSEWRDLTERTDAQRRTLAQAAVRQLRAPLQTVASELRAMQTVFLANDRMDQIRFTQVTENLQRQRIGPARVATAFAVRTDGGGAGQSTYRYQFITPLRGNEVLLGLNIASQHENLLALERARDSNGVVLSAPFVLRQAAPGRHQRLGVTVRLPVYSDGPEPVDVAARRGRAIGALAVSLRLDPLVSDALKGPVLDTFQVSVRDLGANDIGPFYESGTRAEKDAQLYRQLLEFGGRLWELRMWPRPIALDSERLQVILTAGPVISLLLAALLWSLATTRQRAITLGHEMSALYRQSEAQFRALNELLPALVLLSDGDGRILYANQAARLRLGDVVSAGVPLTALFADPAFRERVRQPAQTGDYWGNVEALLIGLGGEFWANASIARVEMEDEPRLLMVATDISEQRELTERLTTRPPMMR